MAKKTKNSLTRIDVFMRKKPLRISLLVAVIVLFGVVGFEVARASLYQARVEAYRQSESIEDIKESVDYVLAELDQENTAYFCVIQPFRKTRSEPRNTNELIDIQSFGQKMTATMTSIHETVQREKLRAPTFGSPLEFIPAVGTARQTSDSLTAALVELADLTDQDSRSLYCNDLDAVFTRFYFLRDISQPQGVTALLPGQIEDFQANAKEAQAYFLSLNPPAILREEHVSLNTTFNQLAVDLRSSTSRPDQFASAIRDNNQLIEGALGHIQEETADLQQVPIQMMIAAEVLR